MGGEWYEPGLVYGLRLDYWDVHALLCERNRRQGRWKSETPGDSFLDEDGLPYDYTEDTIEEGEDLDEMCSALLELCEELCPGELFEEYGAFAATKDFYSRWSFTKYKPWDQGMKFIVGVEIKRGSGLSIQALRAIEERLKGHLDALKEVIPAAAPAHTFNTKKGIEKVSKDIMRPSSRALDLFSHGILIFKNAGDGGSSAQKALGVACSAVGITAFALLLPVYIAGQTMHNVALIGSDFDGEHVSATNTHSHPDSDPGVVTVFDLNAALGDKILYAVNCGGTPFGKISLEDRARQITDAILRDQPDVVTLQEVFSTEIGSFIATTLGHNGYEVFFNVGSRFCGYAGYNSGLLTAVRVTDGGERKVSNCRYHRYSEAANVDVFAAKGVLLVKCVIDGEDVVIANTHLMASDPKPGVEVAIRDNQIQEAVAWIEDFASGAPAILVGDFNCYDHGVNQGKEWLADESNEALGIASTGRAYLRNFEETYLFRDPTHGGSDLPFSEMFVGSDVEESAFAKPFEQVLRVLEDTPFPSIDTASYYMTHFFKRLFRYRFPIPTLEQPFSESVKQLDGYFEKEIALIVENRRIGELPQPPTSLAAKISILLQGRDHQDLRTELEMLGIPAAELTAEEARDRLTEAITTLLENDEEPSRLLEANRSAFYREIQSQFFGRHRNDRVFHQKGATEGFYSVRYDLMHLSDHMALAGTYRIL